jgi:hypothetical protein
MKSRKWTEYEKHIFEAYVFLLFPFKHISFSFRDRNIWKNYSNQACIFSSGKNKQQTFEKFAWYNYTYSLEHCGGP